MTQTDAWFGMFFFTVIVILIIMELVYGGDDTK